MRRRHVLSMIGGAVAWPLGARAQQAGRVRSMGVLLGAAPEEAQGRAIITALSQALQELGWVDGKTARIAYRGTSNAEQLRKHARELVALAPDVLIATGGTSAGPLLAASKTIPIVFANVPDPVASGFVESLSRPGGNATGFVQFEYSLSGKWLELLKQIAPAVRNVAVLWDPSITAGVGQFAVIQSVAPALGVEVRGITVRDAAEIQRAVAAFANVPNGGMIVTASALALVHREPIVAAAAQHKLPTIYFQRVFVDVGGLMSYGPDFFAQYRRAAGYVDRILKGERPADLPVQAPTKYELAINLKTAKAFGLTVPPTLSARADELIE
jgi:putative ABC transport system substrate-binding protein